MSAPLVPIVLVWIIGLLLGESFPKEWVIWLSWSLVAFSIGWSLVDYHSLPGVLLYQPRVYGILLALALFFGAGRASAAQPEFDTTDLATYNDGGRVTIRGTVERYPEVRGIYTRYQIQAKQIELEIEGQPIRKAVAGRFLVNLNLYPAYQYGDELELSGELVTPPILDNFDYRAFLAHKGIYSLLQQGRARLRAEAQGAAIYQLLFTVRRRAELTVQRILPEPHASLMSGILLGIESGIPDDVKEAFNTTGTTHIIVISGSNFAILAAIFLFLGHKLLGKRWGTLFAILFIVLYAMLVGGDPPVLRAAIMGVFAVFALLLQRQAVALNTLALAILLMTAAQPGQLHDVGFQLSALATLGLVLFVDPLTGFTERLLVRYFGLSESQRTRLLPLLSDAILMTLAAQLITTPLIVGTFGRFSVVSLLTNLFILPVQGWLLTSGGLATLAGMLWQPLGFVLASIPFAALEWTLIMVFWTATFPYASIEIGPFPTWSIWATYAVGGFLWWLKDHANLLKGKIKSSISQRGALLWGGILLCVLLPWWISAQRPDGRLHLYVLDVGQGDALLIVSPEGKQILIDGGPDPVPLLAELGDQMPPWDRTIELVILSHADADHLGGLPELLNRYRIDHVMDSGYQHTTALYSAWSEQLSAQSLQPIPADLGQRWALGRGAQLEIIAPIGEPFDGQNNNGVVMRLRYGKFCALLTGDIEAKAEERLLERRLLNSCAVLKVGHHGSKSSSIQPFLDAVRPRYALISAGQDNRFGHPHAEVLERLEAMGIPIFRTDQQGTIHLSTDGEQLWVETKR